MPGDDPRTDRFFPSNNLEDPPVLRSADPPERADEALNGLVPEDAMQPYDIKDVIHRIVDGGYFFEVQEHFAQNLVEGFARLDGRPVGIVANQPAFLAGVLDINASVKGARFVRSPPTIQMLRRTRWSTTERRLRAVSSRSASLSSLVLSSATRMC